MPPFEPFVFLDNALKPFLVRMAGGVPWMFYWNEKLRRWLPVVTVQPWKVLQLQQRAMAPSLANAYGRLEE